MSAAMNALTGKVAIVTSASKWSGHELNKHACCWGAPVKIAKSAIGPEKGLACTVSEGYPTGKAITGSTLAATRSGR
jgi:hypothetical protein